MVAEATVTPEIKRFKLLQSRHYEPLMDLATWERAGHHRLDANRLKMYERGQVVESTRDLDLIFENKFQKLSEEELQPTIDLEARRIEVDRLIAGGVWEEGDRKFLMHLSEENFKRLGNRLTKALNAAPNAEGKSSSILGEDVTGSFQRAYDEGYKVFKNNKNKFQVTTKLELNKPLNRDPLSQVEVDKFVDSYIKSLKE